VKIQGTGGDVILHRDGATEIVGEPFVGVMVWVKAHKNADGSYQALKIALKTTSFPGTVTASAGTTYTVTKEGKEYTVATDGATEFVGDPFVGAVVTVKVYKMADGTYLAYKFIVDVNVLTGVITNKNLGINTIWVDAGEGEIEICIEFANVIGTLEVGAMVEVHVGDVVESTHFATKVIVIVV
jgi:hypothetical protein